MVSDSADRTHDAGGLSPLKNFFRRIGQIIFLLITLLAVDSWIHDNIHFQCTVEGVGGLKETKTIHYDSSNFYYVLVHLYGGRFSSFSQGGNFVQSWWSEDGKTNVQETIDKSTGEYNEYVIRRQSGNNPNVALTSHGHCAKSR